MKNNINHYQHYANSHQHPKFKMLRVKYGWSGEGMFWALNNMIADSEQCQLDLSRKFIVADILDLFQMQHDEFTEFINYLVEDCELIIQEENIITTETVQENYTKVMSKRTRNKSDYESKTTDSEIQNSETTENSFTQNFQTSEKTQSKVKESKVKESKIKKSKVNKLNLPKVGTSFAPSPNHKIEERIRRLFVQHTRIQKPNQQKHINPILKVLETYPPELSDEDLNNCIAEIFQKLNKTSGIKMEFLIENIRIAITKKHELILSKIKSAHLNDRNTDSILANEFQEGVESLSNSFAS